MNASDPRWFVDTNILVFASNPSSPWHSAAAARLHDLRESKIELVVNPQVVREFLAAASRPSPGAIPPPIDQIIENVHRIQAGFILLEENSERSIA